MTDLKHYTPTKLLWIDLEMTGLEPAKDRIIEVAAVVTDWDFNELASYEAVVKQSQDVLDAMNDFGKVHHAASGLTAKVPNGVPESEVEQALCALAEQTFGTDPALLAGNSIHQDRQFIRAWWPELEKKLHYRMLDVTAWKVVMIGKYGVEYKKKETHRAVDDIRESIEELQFYMTKLQK